MSKISLEKDEAISHINKMSREIEYLKYHDIEKENQL